MSVRGSSGWVLLLLLAAGIALAGWQASVTLEGASSAEETPLRWGYDPTAPTGREDALPVFEALPAGYVLESVVSGLDRPTQLAALPDGRLLVAEQRGAVRVVRDGELEPEPLVSVRVYAPAEDPRELGLTGIAVEPEWHERPYVYLYHTADDVRRTVVTRVRIEGDRAVDEKEIISWRARPACCHIGGGLRFLPDGTLLVAAGDHEQPAAAQDTSTPPGSILRITRDGDAAPGNPLGGPVYAYGMRNPFDIAVDPATGRAFAGENGAAGQDAIVELTAGANYGWPGSGLRVPQDEIARPLRFYHVALGLAGMELYTARELGAFTGRLLYCQYNDGGALRAIEFAADSGVARERVIAPGCTSDVTTGADGFIYFLGYLTGTLYRISAAGG